MPGLVRDRPGSVMADEPVISDKTVFVYASRALKAVRTRCSDIAEDLENEPINRLSRGR